MNPAEQSEASPRRVFISYSHDSSEHCDRVLAFVQRLRGDGIDAWIDQFEESTDQGWPLWCARQILDAKYVLLICTESYRNRFLGLEEFGKGRGVKWEAKVIQNILYYKEINTGFIPVIFHDSDSRFVPETVREVSWYLIPASVDDSPDYGKLRQRLTGGYRFSPLGSPARKELYGQREDISVPTVEVWESSERIESKLDELREEQKRQHRTIKWMLAALAALIIVGIVWSTRFTQALVTDPKMLRVKLEEKIEQTFQQKRTELLARDAKHAEINALYHWHEDVLKQLDESVRFIETAAQESRSSIVQKAAVTLQERGVDQALKELTARLDEEGQRHKERARELAEASIFKADLELTKLNYEGAQRAIKQAIDFDYQWWVPHSRIGMLFLERAQWNTAEKEFLEAQRFVEEEKDTAVVLNNLALLLLTTNRLGEGEPLMKRALAIWEKTLGPEHPNVATGVNNLAELYRAQGQYAQAEPLYRRALAIDEKSYGAEHPIVARDLSNLAQLLQDSKRLGEAEPLMRRVLVIIIQFTPETSHPHPYLRVALYNYVALLKGMSFGEEEIRERIVQVGIDADLAPKYSEELLKQVGLGER
jgi:tetratricopeptide (TPR) repeat protein